MTTVGILGVLHDEPLRQRYRFGLERIRELILEFQPDAICGEVLPNSWQKYNSNPGQRGYWGEPASEYWDLIFPLCAERHIDFIPIDWVELDVWQAFDPFIRYSTSRQTELNAELEQWFERQLATFDQSTVPFNSLAFDAVTKQKYEWLQRINPESHLVRWICRHLIMIQRIQHAVDARPGQRLLCIVGADHNHVIHESLTARSDIRVIYPLQSACDS